ncbi:MarR family transcriptional regulator [Pigmentiphaga soli]|uniref:MarR family transcriptional regulator n=1 Tax=Pigmentiphaga soli TaxID=1007095 RepID=A0ABP8H3A2_9BURK
MTPPGKPPGQPPGIEVLEQELAYLARALEAVQRKRRYPLDRAQYLLLALLERDGPLPVTALAERLLLDDSTVTRQVAAMAERGLVDRLPNPADGRSMLIRATPAGLETAGQMRDMRIGRVALLFEGWPDDDRVRMAELLARLNASLRATLSTR